ncbi:Transmembrane protease serine 7 [Bagarius yarrelli]|uniref:Transmembrane protease serine 7 n=1 Tax=Bagarius yarrelli TaxID=175774 RepID=A0A556TWK5_BAGYA|nr:Transmembrane protease serine 7 [Bagarius yarrelli]
MEARGESSPGSEDDAPPPEDHISVTDVSVEVATVDAMLDKLCKKYSRRRRRVKKLKKAKKKPLVKLQNLVLIITGVLFVIVVIMWSLLWVFTFRRESNSGVYFAGMFRVANMEFIPEYRYTDSSEFVSMATQIQHVVSKVYRSSSVSKLYKHTVISDLSNNDKGGVLVHFWMIFVVPRLKTPAVCEECVSTILRDSVLTSLKNRSSVGFLLGLPVDIDSIFINSSECVDKLYAGLPDVRVPLNVFSSWGGLSCHIKLTSSPGTIIRLTVNSLDIEPSDCIHDALNVYDALLPMRAKSLHRYCGRYVSHATVFRIPERSVEVVFRCSSRNSELPFSATYSSFNISQQTGCSGMWYQCSNEACILKKNAKCDGLPDCLDHSDEENCACGQSTPVKRVMDSAAPQERVVGGVNSIEGEWPWQVSLHFSGHLYCGASVITSDWLVSAAHCFSKERLSDPRQWMAHLGMVTQGSAKHVAEIRRILVHEYYNARNFDYDIALLQLRKPWPSSLASFIQPVCLPASSQTLPERHRCWVTGWGYRSEQDKILPTVLQKAEVRVLSHSECKKAYGLVSPRMLCAGVPTGAQDACRGDSGGPLSCQASEGGRWFLTGIVSWGSGCGRPNFPGVYTRVAKFISWINSHIYNS